MSENTGCYKRTFDCVLARADFHLWCQVMWDHTGRVIILSDFGNWSYQWMHRGDGVTVPQFLADLDCEYMGGKMLGTTLWAMDMDATVAAIRKHVAEQRHDGEITPEQARAELQRVQWLEDCDCSFDNYCRESMFAEPWGFYRRKLCDCWKNFWDRLWVPHIVPVLKDHVKANAEPGSVS